GTGLVTLALAREARWVVATDYSRAMVSLLEKRVRAAGLSNVECRQADPSLLHEPPQGLQRLVPGGGDGFQVEPGPLQSGGRELEDPLSPDVPIPNQARSREHVQVLAHRLPGDRSLSTELRRRGGTPSCPPCGGAQAGFVFVRC